MIEITENVLHDGGSYKIGDNITEINRQEAQRLVNLGVAFFVSENQYMQEGKTENLTGEHTVYVKEELNAIEYQDLKVIGEEVGLEFPGNIAKAKLVDMIIDNGKADEALAMTEEE